MRASGGHVTPDIHNDASGRGFASKIEEPLGDVLIEVGLAAAVAGQRWHALDDERRALVRQGVAGNARVEFTMPAEGTLHERNLRPRPRATARLGTHTEPEPTEFAAVTAE